MRGIRCTAICSVLLVAGLVVPASAQVLSAPSLGNASSPNEATASTANPSYQRFSSTSTLSSGAASFATRYFGNASADCGPACGSRNEVLSSNYTVSWTATAPNIYALSIATRRTAGLTIGDDGGNGAQAVMDALSCTPTGGTVTSGACTLANPADNTSGSTSDVNVNQTNTLNVCGQSLGAPVNHSVNFTWSQNALTPSTGFIQINMDEAAVRLGANNLDASNGAANYPGTGARTQSNDGHFVTVTLTNLCGNSVIDICGANSEECDQGGLNGTAGSCCNSNCTLKSNGTGCRGVAGVCDQAEACDGVSPTCPADTFLPPSTVCRAGTAGEVCDATENCTGGSPNCPADLVLPNGTPCRNSAGVCDTAETCDGSSKFCPADAKSTAECRASAGVCDVAESCDGVGDNCPADAKSTASCRASAGACDLEDFCDGVGDNCPADAKSTAECRASAGACDIAESCDGVGDNCPADAKSTAECRAAADICDVAEVCDGSNDDCPADAFVPSSVECRASAGDCDVAESCTGSSAACPADGFQPSSTVCRASSVGEVCDIEENCTGSSANCPADQIEPASTVCRASSVGEVCDIAEFCDGTNKTCPADAVESSSVVCRATTVGEECDVAENCDGTNKTCPVDAVLPNNTTCRISAGICDVTDVCDGSSKICPTDAKSTAVCRPSAGTCDVAESCDGVGDTCPADGFVLDGTNCDDALYCNGTQTCTGGTCGGGSSPCAMGESCDEAGNVCFSGNCPVSPTSCAAAGKNKLLIKNNTSDNGKDKLVWKWTKGVLASTQTDFADPVSGTADYSLCFYTGNALIQSAEVPAGGGKWSAISTKGYKYKDTGPTGGSNDGITKIILKSGAAGKGKALVKGKGLNLPDFDSNLPVLMGDLPMVVQLRNKQNGMCWGGSFSAPKKNLLTQFNAKQP